MNLCQEEFDELEDGDGDRHIDQDELLEQDFERLVVPVEMVAGVVERG